MNCNQCGTCCKCICLKHSPYFLIKDAIERPTDDKIFMLKNWEPITREEAEQTNPYLIEQLGNNKGYYFFYTCKMLKDGKCSVHEKKPKVCSEYPYLNKEKKPESLIDGIFYAEDCGFKKSVDNLY